MGVFLYLMRHGAAEDAAPSGRDADRSLTPAGRLAVRRIALALRDAHGGAGPTGPAPLALGRIIASPYARAHETAEIMGSLLAPELAVELDDDLTPDGSAFDLAARIATGAPDTLLVGHQPNIEMVARALAIAAPRERPSSPRDPRSSRPSVKPAGPSSVRMPPFRTATLVGFRVGGRPPPYALVLAFDPNELAPP